MEHRRFNESFLPHSSTSPFYLLFAWLGMILWDDTLRLGIELRKKLRALRHEYEQKEAEPARRWFFGTFVPDVVSVPGEEAGACAREVPWESLTTDELASEARYWTLEPGATLHGFEHLETGLAMTDPNKLIVLTPGFDSRTDAYANDGVYKHLQMFFVAEALSIDLVHRLGAGRTRAVVQTMSADS